MPRRIPRTAVKDVCSFNLNSWKRKSSNALMKEWARRGASGVARTNIQGDIKGWLANYATYKSARRRGDKRAMRTYSQIAKLIEADIRAAQKGCS
jgi:hypothetical protein